MKNNEVQQAKKIFLQELDLWEKSISEWASYSYQSCMHFECKETKTNSSVNENSSTILEKMFFLSVKEKWLPSAFSMLLNLSSEDKKNLLSI